MVNVREKWQVTGKPNMFNNEQDTWCNFRVRLQRTEKGSFKQYIGKASNILQVVLKVGCTMKQGNCQEEIVVFLTRSFA